VESPLPVLVFDWRRPKSFLQVAMAASITPRDFFTQVPAGEGIGGPILFLVAAHVIPSLVAAAVTLPQGLGAALLMFAMSMVPPIFITISFAALVFAVVQFIMVSGTKFSLPQAISVVCYSSGVQALSFLPWFISTWAGLLFSLIMMLFILYLISEGIRVVAGVGKGQTLAAILLAFTIVVLAAVWLGFTKSANRPPPSQGSSPAAAANHSTQ
jgi:hypothetical protein